MINDTRKYLKPLIPLLLIAVFFFFMLASSSKACMRIMNVTTNLEEATFTINGPRSYSGSGKEYSVILGPEGTYTIVFGDVEGYITPPSESHFILADNYDVTFEGIYEWIKVKGNIIVGAGHGPQNQAFVRVLDSVGADTGLEFFANDYKYGVNVASADLDGDGIDEIITGAGPGPQNPAEVRVFVYDSSEQKFIDSGIDLLAHDSKYGVNVAAGDVDGDGIPEIITERGHGPSNMWDIKRWKVDTSSGEAGNWSVSLLQ